MRGSGTAVHTFDDGASLWFEVEIVGAGEGGGGGTVTFATSDAWEAQDGLTLQLDEYVSTDEDYVPVRADAELRAAGYEAGDSFFIVQIATSNTKLSLLVRTSRYNTLSPTEMV